MTPSKSHMSSVKNMKNPSAKLFRAIREDVKIHLIDEHNSDLYALINEGIVGGLSIIFSHHHKKDKTRLHPTECTNAKVCKQILGVDASALYFYCMMQKVPVA